MSHDDSIKHTELVTKTQAMVSNDTRPWGIIGTICWDKKPSVQQTNHKTSSIRNDQAWWIEMQESCVPSQPMQKLKSEELPWRNPWWAQCDIHAGATCGLAQRMQMKAWSRWESGTSRYKSCSFSKKEPRQAEPSWAHRVEQWPKLCIVQSMLSLEQSNRGVDKLQALFPVHVLARYWCQ